VAGVVVGPDGETVAGVRITPNPTVFRDGEVVVAVSGRDGRFLLEGLPRHRTYGLEIEPHPDLDEPEPEEVYLVAFRGGVRPPVEHLELRLERGRYLEAVVLDGDGDPLPARSVRLAVRGPLDAAERLEEDALSTADGRVWLGPLPPGRYLLWAESPSPLLAPREPREVLVPGPRLSVTMPDATIVAGELRGADLEGFKVAWHRGPPGGPCFGREVEVDDDGRFRLGGVGPWPVTLRAHHPRDGRYAVARGVPPGTEDNRLRLRPGLTIAGWLESPGLEPRPRIAISHTEFPLRRTAVPDDDGHVVLRALPDGRYDLETVDGFWRLVSPREVRAGTQDVRFVLER
jgi:hypothetical protein